MLIGLGIYILRGYICKPKAVEKKWADFDSAGSAPNFVSALNESGYRNESYDSQADYSRGSQAGGWKNR